MVDAVFRWREAQEAHSRMRRKPANRQDSADTLAKTLAQGPPLKDPPSSKINGSSEGTGPESPARERENLWPNKPLMPKATAVWLVDNTSLTFEQIADFCGLHPLEVKGIADEDVAKGIKGQDPVASGQLTREQIEEAEKNPKLRLKMAPPKHKMPPVKLKKRAALHPGVQAPGQARCGLLDHPQPSRIRRRRHHQADRHHQGHDPEDPRALALERAPTSRRSIR